MLFYLVLRSTCITLPGGEGRLRFGITNKKIAFLFGTPLNLHYLCTAF